MRVRNNEVYNEKKEQIMQACFECFAENGLHGTGIAAVAKYANVSKATLYVYFADLDKLITESTAYCMANVEDDFMAKAPKSIDEMEKFIDEIPYWTAKTHGKKYRLMYQVYTHPKYIEYGKRFFSGVDERYLSYAKALEPRLNISSEIITPLIFFFVRACVYYALFEDEFYLQTQMQLLKKSVKLFVGKGMIK